MRFFQLQFHDEGIPSSWNIFTEKNKKYYVYLPIPYNLPSLSRDHQTVIIMNHCCDCFDGLWKVKKVKYIILYLNALTKLQNARGGSCHPPLMDNCPSCNHMPWPFQSTEWFVISPFQVMCGHDILWPQERCLLGWKLTGNVCMQVNVLKNIAWMTRRLCVLIMSHMCFRVNLQSGVAWMSRNSLLETDATYEV